MCEGQSLDVCKDTPIECNNDGYDCYVTCMMENSCSGATNIRGPVNGALSVTCYGDKSCEGNTHFDASMGTHFTENCDGMTSCKVACNGDPDSCLSSFWNLLPGARSMQGAAIEFIGQFCPINTPEPFRFVFLSYHKRTLKLVLTHQIFHLLS